MRLVVIGGSDAGITAALHARQLDAAVEVTVLVADAFPNFSICGIPYYVSGEVSDWHDLAHRSLTDLQATGIELRLDTHAHTIDPDQHRVLATAPAGEQTLGYDALIIATGARPIRPPIPGVDLGPENGVHLLHTMGDTFTLVDALTKPGVERAVIVGGGYIGLEMAEALAGRGLSVIQLEQLPEILPTVDPQLGSLVHLELERHGVTVACNTRVQAIETARPGSPGRLEVRASRTDGQEARFAADIVLVVVGVQPDSRLAAAAGARLGVKGAIEVDRRMRTSLPDVFAAGDCAVTHHRLLGPSYLPLGTTAHKQGRTAAENALGESREFAGSLGTQVVRVFELVAARSGLRETEARPAGFDAATIAAQAPDHNVYYPDSHPIAMRYTGDRPTGRLLGLQLVGGLGSEIAKRVDIAAGAIFAQLTIDQISDLDLSYTPPLGSPWDALQTGAQAWEQEARNIRRDPSVRADTDS